MQTTYITQSVKNLADSPETFHIVVPQRAKLAAKFDAEIGGDSSRGFFPPLPSVACIGGKG